MDRVVSVAAAILVFSTFFSTASRAQMASYAVGQPCSPNGASAFVDIPLRILKCAAGAWADWVPGEPTISAAAPTAAACDSDLERGRFAMDTTLNLLYVCNGAIRGWDYVVLVP